jgi:hypothetical protein
MVKGVYLRKVKVNMKWEGGGWGCNGLDWGTKLGVSGG